MPILTHPWILRALPACSDTLLMRQVTRPKETWGVHHFWGCWAIQYAQGFLWSQKWPYVAAGKIQRNQTQQQIWSKVGKTELKANTSENFKVAVSCVDNCWKGSIFCRGPFLNSNKTLRPTDLCMCWLCKLELPRESLARFQSVSVPLFLHTGTPYTCL